MRERETGATPVCCHGSTTVARRIERDLAGRLRVGAEAVVLLHHAESGGLVAGLEALAAASRH